jgi:hypothetical protein
MQKEDLVKIVDKETENSIEWLTPTSIFIGISPLKLEEDFKAIKVRNPVENRYQEEKFRVGNINGIVLRGGTKYGWSKQPLKIERKPGEYSYQPATKRDEFASLEKAIETQKKSNGVKPLFDYRHLSQYKRMISALSLPAPIEKLKKEFDSYKIVARLYGGGLKRKAVTFQTLYDKYNISEIPEQWGSGVSQYSNKTKDYLIGCEYKLDGTLQYIRLKNGDLPKYKS